MYILQSAVEEQRAADAQEDQAARLISVCRAFLRKNRITCPETTCEDRVYENAPELVEQIADILGYEPVEV